MALLNLPLRNYPISYNLASYGDGDMPLNLAQEEFIKASIDHLLSFSNNYDELINQIQALHTALLPDSMLVDDNEFAQLRECLHHPQNNFLRLETLNNNAITIANVKSYLLNYIDTQVQTAIKAFPNINWDIPSIAAKTISHEDNTAFMSQMIKPLESTPAYNEIRERALIYHSIIQDHFPLYCLEVKVNFNENDCYEEVCDFHFANTENEEGEAIPLPLMDYERATYLESLRPLARRESRRIALSATLDYLASKNRIKRSDYSVYEISRETTIICLHQFYFGLLEQGKIKFADIVNISRIQAESLLHPNIINLIFHDMTNIHFILSMKPPLIKICKNPYFIAEINKNPTLLDIFSEINLEQSKFLTSPALINLLRTNNITIDEAISLPPSQKLLRLLTTPFYYEKLLHNHNSDIKFKWSHLSQLNDNALDLLLESDIIKFIATLNLHPNDFFTLVLRDKMNENYGRFLTDQLMVRKTTIETLERIKATAPLLLKELDRHPYLDMWIIRKVICIEDLIDQQLHQLIGKAFGKRLFAVFQQRPYVLLHKIDSLENIENDLFVIAIYDDIPNAYLKAYALKICLKEIHDVIADELRIHGYGSETHKDYWKLMQVFRNENINFDEQLQYNLGYWGMLLDRLIMRAKDLLFLPPQKQSLKRSPRFTQFPFYISQQPKSPNKFYTCCEQIISLEKFCQSDAKMEICEPLSNSP